MTIEGTVESIGDAVTCPACDGKGRARWSRHPNGITKRFVKDGEFEGECPLCVGKGKLHSMIVQLDEEDA